MRKRATSNKNLFVVINQISQEFAFILNLNLSTKKLIIQQQCVRFQKRLHYHEEQQVQVPKM